MLFSNEMSNSMPDAIIKTSKVLRANPFYFDFDYNFVSVGFYSSELRVTEMTFIFPKNLKTF